MSDIGLWVLSRGGGGVLPYMGYIGIYMCHCEGYGFQAVYFTTQPQQHWYDYDKTLLDIIDCQNWDSDGNRWY